MANRSWLLLALLAAFPAVRASADDEADVENYRLTMPVVRKLQRVQENLYESIKKDPSQATKFKKILDDGLDQPLASMVKKVDGVPEVKQAIAKAGLTTREYLLATLAMFEAGMSQAMLQAPAADTSKLPAGVRANMKFMEQNRAEFTQMQKRTQEIESATKKLTARGAKKDTEADEEPPADEGPDKQ